MKALALALNQRFGHARGAERVGVVTRRSTREYQRAGRDQRDEQHSCCDSAERAQHAHGVRGLYADGALVSASRR
jgi:hypothetical protein